MKTGEDLRDRFDLASGIADFSRGAQGGGPKQYVRSPTGRPRGADRFPSSKSSKRRMRRGKR